jgi:hypothetical protein
MLTGCVVHGLDVMFSMKSNFNQSIKSIKSMLTGCVVHGLDVMFSTRRAADELAMQNRCQSKGVLGGPGRVHSSRKECVHSPKQRSAWWARLCTQFKANKCLMGQVVCTVHGRVLVRRHSKATRRLMLFFASQALEAPEGCICMQYWTYTSKY